MGYLLGAEESLELITRGVAEKFRRNSVLNGPAGAVYKRRSAHPGQLHPEVGGAIKVVVAGPGILNMEDGAALGRFFGL